MPFRLLGCLILSVQCFWAQAVTIDDVSLEPFEVRFTNPDCGTYKYRSPVRSVGGETLFAKPKDAYCEGRDISRNLSKNNGPYQKIRDWIWHPETEEIFLSFLSFSSSRLRRDLCRAMEYRNIKVTMVLDDGTDLEQASILEKACKDQRGNNNFRLVLRGDAPGIRYAHNKLMIFNPNSKERIRLAFGSANLSLGLSLHHENWHFATVKPRSYFAQSHLCLMEGVLDHGFSSKQYRTFMNLCLNKVERKFKPERDVRVFFIPGHGYRGYASLEKAFKRSYSVKVAAHRLLNRKIINWLKSHLSDGSGKIIVDDDMYWAKHDPDEDLRNSSGEYRTLQSLGEKGLQARYMETNQDLGQLHHNKFIIFKGDKYGAVWTGAGNLTNAAFTSNFENFYFFRNQKVVNAYERQYEYLWDLASQREDLPEKNMKP